jgi:hypothetical protein
MMEAGSANAMMGKGGKRESGGDLDEIITYF